MVTLLAIVTCAGAGLIGGVFFAFSAFVMKALSELPDEQGITAMQRINVVVLDPLFLGVFLGTAALAATCTFAAFHAGGPASALLLSIAGMSYLVGSVGVTIAFNVPRNERLARLPAASPEAAAYWPAYVREWLVWNHVRTAASIVSAISAAAALAC